MSYAATVFNVMIASPGDVESERAIIREVIYEWNAINSESKNTVLLPVGWETHASPEMGSHPQEIINRQVADKCDLLVGVFWTRIGTPTNKYSSGTVEEIEEHIRTGKPAMLYYSSKPVVMESVDLDQYTQLRQFKDSCRGRGLYEEYDNLIDFKQKFYQHLQIKVNEHTMFRDVNTNIDENQVNIESDFVLPVISEVAKVLLREASKDKEGTILFLKHFGGTDLLINDKNLITSNERREVAKWEGALDELLRKELIIERGKKGEVFEISSLGYQLADTVKL